MLPIGSLHKKIKLAVMNIWLREAHRIQSRRNKATEFVYFEVHLSSLLQRVLMAEIQVLNTLLALSMRLKVAGSSSQTLKTAEGR